MVFTAVLAAIAVIAAMVTVPGAKAEAIQIQPDNDSFGSDTEKLAGVTKGWGTMVWAGAPIKDPNKEWTTDFGKAGNRGSNAGWAWCVDISKAEPMRNTAKYDIATAGKAPIPENLRDAAINVATLSKQALKKGEEGRQTVATYSYYLSALIGDNSSSKIARHGIVDPESMKNDEYVGPVFKDFKGSLKEFESLTGFTINPNEPWELQKLDSVSVPKAPEGAFITLVGPNGRLTGPTKPGEKIGKNANDQRVMPPDQPGLPDNPDNGGGSEEPTTSDENTAEETTSENPEDETSSSETTTDSEPTDSEETTTEDTEEPNPGKTTDVVPNPDPTPTTEEQEKEPEPKIGTEASFDGDKQQVIAGATVKDKVSYEGLVPGKKYTLKAELINKKDGKSVLGTGEKTFKPETSNGKVEVEITVNDDVKEPVEAAVAFEELSSTDVNDKGEDTPDTTPENPNDIAEHKDINDKNQTVTSKPHISTNADFANGSKEVVAGATVIDEVDYSNLVVGKEYTLKAELINKKDGKSVLGTGEKTFKPETSNGKVEVEITVNDDVKEPVEAAVAFEELSSTDVNDKGEDTPDTTPENPNDIAEHKDINDKNQTVTSKPHISTNADFANGSKEVVAGATVIDEVDYSNLVVGKEYTLKAELINKKDGKSVLGTGEKTFKPETSNGKVEVEITVNDDVKEPVEAAVAFEELSSTDVNDKGEDTPDTTPENPNDIAEHKDINDKNQTVTSKPHISTNADFANGSKEVVAGATVIDEVDYSNLVVGKEYTLKAELINKKDGKSVLGTGEKTFKPETSNGKVEVEITVNDDVKEPVEAAVAFEELSSTDVNDKGEDTPDTTPENPNDIAEHKDINDKNQTVTSKPHISTNADFANGSKEVVAGATVIDEVDYSNLVVGKEYTLKAELINKKDGKSVLGTGEKTFKPETSNGKVEVEITVNDDVKEPVEAAVAFEELSSTDVNDKGEDTPDTTPENPNDIAEHKDINDKNQTVTSKPHISTNADFANGSKEVVAGATVIDEVDYSNLVVGKEYTLKAELINKKDGKSVLGTGEKTFKPETSNGKVEVEITVNDDVKEPVEAAVAFEELSSTDVNDKGEDTPDTTPENPNDIAEHKDINDKNQTVTSKPHISTNADFANGSKEVVAGATVIDEVDYSNLVVGKEYTLKAELINKKDGKSVLGTGEKTFKPETSNGKVEVEITVNDDVKEPVEAAVAFEELSSTDVNDKGEDTPDTTPENPNDIAEHKDINDKNQTVTSKPHISTNADFANGSKEVVAGATVIDEVDYSNLVVGKEYTLKAELINKKDGKSVLGTGEKTFKPETSNGKVEVEITVNDDVKEPVEAAVAFEELSSTDVNDKGEDTPDTTPENPNDIAEHKDINDKNQTVTSKPHISTNADFANGSKEVVAGATVIDEVDYSNLVVGKEYTLKAELINKKDGKSVLGTGEKTFKPETSNGKVEVEITVNDDVKEPVEAAVAFEELSSTDVNDKGEDTPDTTPENPNDIAEHKDINDKNQTVTSHKNAIVSTNADFENGSKEVVAGAKIVDQVSYEGLVPGKEYSLDAQLISKDDGKTVLGETKGHTFTPDEANGFEAVTITVNDDVTEPVEAAVAFETLTSKVVNDKGEDTPDNDKPNEIGEHKDINDEDQTVPKGDKPSETTTPSTTTTDVVPGKPDDGGEDETSTPSSSEDSSTSTTSETCESEEPGDSESEQPSESEEPSESESSEPSESESVETTSSEASETSESDEPSDCGSTTPNKPGEPTEPTDPNEPGTPNTPGGDDEKDTPKVSTNADFEGGLREVVAGAKIVDQVSYKGLVPGKEYTLDAQLISKEDGKTVLGETKGHKFTPDEANGTEAVTIVVDDSVTEPVEAAVAFETLTSTQVDKHGEDNPTDEDNPNPVGEHKDINDDDQTVTTETPKITTNADFEKGSHEVVAGAKIVDEVTYEGLVPGKEYTLKAELINKKDGKSVLGKGEATFTPKKSKGKEPVTITVNDDVKEPVQAAVAFEELTSTEVNDKGEETPGTTSEKPNHIAEHKDINDDDQTVISHEVHDQDKPGGSSDGSSNGSSNGSSDGSSNGSSKDNKWWLILIPGIGLGKIIKDHFDHKDHGNHNGGHGDNTGNHDGGNGKHTDGHNGGNGHEVKGQDAPKGGNSDNGHGRGVEVQGQEPEETGNALPSNAERVEIKSVPSGATELEPGMQDYIK
ncbi:VaFE repeat-containing surface-anchored protein [Corynebacterium tuberculostearicum]|uniref:VaFE repeat-containing surface-anchored protein n=1 Tax=Corynebacterium tuberculostearicum TaxID=38304 RepID=UPI0038CFF346